MVVKNRDFQSAAGEMLALAVLDIFPSAKIVETYPTELGFGVDFLIEHPLDATGFSLIDERLRILMKKNLAIEPVSMMRENAAALLKAKGQEFLAEKVLKSPENVVDLIRIGEFYGFTSLAEEVASKEIGEGKLIDYALQSGDSFATLEGVLCKDVREVKKFLKKYEESKKSDHRLLAEELELFLIPVNALAGCWTALPKGEAIKEILITHWKKSLHQEGYSFVHLPKWYEISGQQRKNERFGSRLHVNQRQVEYLSDYDRPFWEIFGHKDRKDTLPLRLAEISERLAPCAPRQNLGLLTSEVFTGDISYTFCTESQAMSELISSLQFLLKWIKIFAIDYQWYLVANNPKTTENQRSRDQRVVMLREALQQCGCSHAEDSEVSLNRGPRIEARFIDFLGREWKGPCIELDVTLLDASGGGVCKSSGNKGHRPQVIKRSLFGSLERVVALMLERSAGHLPLWLAPEQVRVIPLKEQHRQYAQDICNKLCQNGIRAVLDCSKEALAAKVFAVKTAKIPYAVVVGDDEQRNGTIAVCPCEEKSKGRQEKLSAFVEKLQGEIKAKGPFALEQGAKMELLTD